MSGPRRSCAVLFALAVVVSLAPLASASPAETQAIREVAATAFFGSPQASISGSVAERFGPVLASFEHDSGGAESWSETDTVSESDASAQADQAYAMTSGVGGLAKVEATGSATAVRRIEARVVDASSGYSVTFELQEPTPFSVTGTVSASANTSGLVLGVAGASLSPGIFNVHVNAETSGQVTKPVSMTGVLPPDDYTLSVSAGASGGTGARPPANTSATVGFDIEFTLNPPSATAPIIAAGGPEPSNLELKVDSLSPGFRYTFTDSAPLQISDSRCQPPSGGAIVCESPVVVPVSADLGAGDDTVQLSGSHPFSDLSLEGGPDDDTLEAAPSADGGDGDDTITSFDARCGAGECLLEGGAGDDVLTGGSGRDRLRGGEGSDQLRGGGGDEDWADYADFLSGITAKISDFSAEPAPASGRDFINGDVENVAGGDGDDTLAGDEDDNRLDGGDGDDELVGGIGGPFLGTADGEDVFSGGAGTDTLAYDQLVGNGAIATIGGNGRIANTSELDTVDGDIEGIRGSDENDVLVGNDNENLLEGDAGEDHLEGKGAADELRGGADDDTLIGGGGADFLVGGETTNPVVQDSDTVQYDGVAPVTVTLGDGLANDGGGGRERRSG